MLKGNISSRGFKASESRIREAMMKVDPLNHAMRVHDGQRRFNPAPYNAHYFGHKLHVDLNEKLVDYNSVLIGAIDGFSGLVVAMFSVPKKNNQDVYLMYRLVLKSSIDL
jgi:hypothetical protein